MRGVIVAVVGMFMLGVLLLVGIVTIEPLADQLTENHADALEPVNGEETITELRTIALKWVVPVFIFGVGVLYPVVWYLRREGVLSRAQPRRRR